jgi:ArsR family transcriptional regulator, arsenate/arsenite/antimonite-responsive transcriptional repressor
MNTKPRPAGCCTIPIPPPALAEATREGLVTALKALADPTRLEVFRFIAAQDDPICACDVAAHVAVSQPTVSHHLQVLRKAGLVRVSRQGVWGYYAVDQDAFGQLQEALAALVPSRHAIPA